MKIDQRSAHGRFAWFAPALVLALVPAAATRAEEEDRPRPQPGYFNTHPTTIQTLDGGDTLLGRVVVALPDPAVATVGATLEPLAEPLRAQLALPNEQGLIVASLAADGPAARAGLEEKDILLTLDDKPLASPDDLSEQLKAAGKAPLTLKLLRRGKPVRLRVQPAFRVTLEAADKKEANNYYIGVMLDPPDDALRAHLELPEGKGQLVTRIVPGSPAEKAGVKVYDILLEIGGKTIDGPETLIAQVQASQGKPIALKLLRAGKPMTLDVTPELRTVVDYPHYREAVRLWSLGHQAHPGMYPWMAAPPAGPPFETRAPFPVPHASPDRTERRLDALDRELKALRRSVDELREALKDAKEK